MALDLYLHPFASYCQKVVMAFYEKDVPFNPVMVDHGDPASLARFQALWPMPKMPILHDTDRDVIVPETSIIIEYLETHYPGSRRLIPLDPDAAREVRLWDRTNDLYLHNSMQKMVGNYLRPPAGHDNFGVEEARSTITSCYAVLDARMASREWIAGPDLTMADCAAAPALFYANELLPIEPAQPNLTAYFQRLMNRPSYRRVLEEARPYFHLFPVGHPPTMPDLAD